jgi:hypothetical protein
MEFDICPDCHGLTNIWVSYHKETVDLLVLTRKPHQMLGGKNRCARVAFR